MAAAAVAAVLGLTASCSGDDDGTEGAEETEDEETEDGGQDEEAGTGDGNGEPVAVTPEPTNCGDEMAEPELRDELLEMQEADQAERTSAEAPAVSGDRERTDRLREIIDDHGWPTCDLVGEDGNSAAWVIAQHSDQDVEFQQEALELMRETAAEGLTDATEVAYLEDRVAVALGEPQRYGTQAACVDGHAQVQELADPAGVDELRAEVGMEPLDAYLAELEASCTAT